MRLEKPRLLAPANDPLRKIRERGKGLRWFEHGWAGAPLLLVTVGGLVGALFGMGAYDANIAIIKSKFPPPMKHALALVVSALALMLFLVAGLLLYQWIQAQKTAG